jgi:signal transduction histidine kinase
VNRRRLEPASASDPLGVVAGEAAQELGSALTAIQVALERLERRWGGSTPAAPGTPASWTPEAPPPPELALIRGQAERLSILARRLRLVAQPTESHPVCWDLTEALNRLVPAVRRGLAEEGISLEVALADRGGPLRVRADPARTREVVLALLANARRAVLDAPPPRWIHLVATPSTAPHSEGFVELMVRDSGPGVAPGQEERIFLPFVSGWGGQGLGLTRARLTLSLQEGALFLRSHPAGGTEFVLRMRSAPDPEPPASVLPEDLP